MRFHLFWLNELFCGAFCLHGLGRGGLLAHCVQCAAFFWQGLFLLRLEPVAGLAHAIPQGGINLAHLDVLRWLHCVRASAEICLHLLCCYPKLSTERIEHALDRLGTCVSVSVQGYLTLTLGGLYHIPRDHPENAGAQAASAIVCH